MVKLGVITDGISREFEYALSVMNEFDLSYASEWARSGTGSGR